MAFFWSGRCSGCKAYFAVTQIWCSSRRQDPDCVLHILGSLVSAVRCLACLPWPVPLIFDVGAIFFADCSVGFCGAENRPVGSNGVFSFDELVVLGISSGYNRLFLRVVMRNTGLIPGSWSVFVLRSPALPCCNTFRRMCPGIRSGGCVTANCNTLQLTGGVDPAYCSVFFVLRFVYYVFQDLDGVSGFTVEAGHGCGHLEVHIV